MDGAESFDEDEQFVFIEADDGDRVYDEDEVQIALASYQEVRKAISSYQKGVSSFVARAASGVQVVMTFSRARERFISKS